ncbi:MAG: glycosyl hydrolase, partial [Myxococcota bacterium]|nr:glycosyl hydrolase [Myxococcota bacterium]
MTNTSSTFSRVQARTLFSTLFMIALWGAVGCSSGGDWPIEMDVLTDPVDEARPIMRWWWPGGSVKPTQLTSELEQLSELGFGAVEIQPFTFGLDQVELQADGAIHSVGTPGFFEDVRHAMAEGERLGLQVDMTLGSGWPGGGPFVGEHRAQELLVNWYDMEGGTMVQEAPPGAGTQTYVAQVQGIIDALEPVDTVPERLAVTAARRGGSEGSSGTGYSEMMELTDLVEGDVLRWDIPEGQWRVFSLSTHDVGHLAVGAAYPVSEEPAWVFDHLSEDGVAAHLQGYGIPLLEATGDLLPHALFVDSFEMIGQLPWTEDFLTEFERRKGYVLTPYLPFIFVEGGETKYGGMFESEPSMLIPSEVGERVREDYVDVRAELFLSRCVKPLHDFARDYGTALRLQAHGGYAHVLDAYAQSDIPESEGLYAGGSMDFLKLASSAAHVAGRREVTSESFVTVNLDDATLSVQDFYMLSARAYAAGINRLVFHGFAYDYPTLDGRRWFPFAPADERVSAGPLRITTAINETHPLWSELPGFTQYLGRLSQAMMVGEPEVSVAWLMPEHEIPDEIALTMGGVEGKSGESSLSKRIRGLGFDYDRISPSQLLASGAADGRLTGKVSSYDVLLVENLEVAEPAWLEHI